jgi:hypothetical protein
LVQSSLTYAKEARRLTRLFGGGAAPGSDDVEAFGSSLTRLLLDLRYRISPSAVVVVVIVVVQLPSMNSTIRSSLSRPTINRFVHPRDFRKAVAQRETFQSVPNAKLPKARY